MLAEMRCIPCRRSHEYFVVSSHLGVWAAKLQYTYPMALILLFCGLPGSGKTTAATELKTRLLEHGMLVTQISFDQVYEATSDDALYSEEAIASADCTVGEASLTVTPDSRSDNSLQRWHKAREEALQLAVRAVGASDAAGTTSGKHTMRHVIILDDNFYYGSMRKAYRQLAVARRFCTGLEQFTGNREIGSHPSHSLQPTNSFDTVGTYVYCSCRAVCIQGSGV